EPLLWEKCKVQMPSYHDYFPLFWLFFLFYLLFNCLFTASLCVSSFLSVAVVTVFLSAPIISCQFLHPPPSTLLWWLSAKKWPHDSL
ncbi:hypothetical protein DFJ73DRAFT_840508, partial [Zopfochytrium polystomum]